jgi:hypothetical protein
VVRKIIYSLIVVAIVLVINQIQDVDRLGSGTTGSAIPIATNIMTGSVELRISSTAAGSEISAAVMTISSVDIYLASGWAAMKMDNGNTVDLARPGGLEQTVASANDLNQGTYTQIRLNIAKVSVTLQGSQPKQANLVFSKVTFTQNFQVTAKNATVLVINIDPARSISTSNNQVTFTPAANLLYTTPGALQIVNPAPPQAAVGVPYQTTLTAIGGQRPYTWSITMGDLPTGVTLDAVSGVLSGTPTKPGIFGFTVRLDDRSASPKNTIKNYIIGVTAAGALQILTGSLPDGIPGVSYRAVLQAVGGAQPYIWGLVANILPAGLTLDAASGIISGTPASPGDATFVVKVTSGDNPDINDTQSLSIHVGRQTLSK